SMNLATKSLAAIILFGLIAAVAFASWLFLDWSREISPATYASWLDTDRAVYADVDSVSESDLQLYAYAYERNKYADAIPEATRLPRIANADGYVPAFKLGDDTFILVWKWVNSSAGLAISDSSDFKTKIETLDDRFRVRHVSGNIYEWDLDLESGSQP
ncbi:hypothetical protein, partial [Roseiconus nitratireducens]|uniref:hypothetical protein n=1 Tax=Roseiconus nitratireducens TaxID=2605748 RepID=UPI001375A24D